MIEIGRYERLEAPAEFNQLLADIFGTNMFGAPNFKIVWGQTETYKLGTPDGYTDKLVGHGMPCWTILRWKSPECFGTPEMWYSEFTDPQTGICLLGEYPHEGFYEVMLPLIFRQFNPETQKLETTTPQLDWNLIELFMPIAVAALDMNMAEKRAAQDREKQFEHDQQVKDIADRLAGELPSFYGPTVYGGATRSSHLQKKMEEIEKQWKQMDLKQRPKEGFFQQN
jgi:hypothetical protein